MSRVFDNLLEITQKRSQDIEAWFEAEYAKTPPFFYTSVDLRHSGDKLAAIDTNLFPAGFNNLTPAAQERAVEAAKTRLKHGEKVLIVPELHTRNKKYLDNLVVLTDILTRAGAEVQIGTLMEDQEEPLELVSANETALTQYPLKREGARLMTREGFDPDFILVNNDMTTGAPELLQGLEQEVNPCTGMGWYRRKKSAHFQSYQQVVNQFGRDMGINSWRLQAEFQDCGQVNFKEMTGLECVAMAVEKLVHSLKEKYATYGVEREPVVFVKSDVGTYGMGVMTVRSGEEVMNMNRNTRKKMNVIKSGTLNTSVIIQEGIPTIDKVEGQSAEPMLYLVQGQAVGGAYRVHSQRSAEENLNSVGMRFVPLCCDGNQPLDEPTHCDFRVLRLVAQLASLAAAREGEECEEEREAS